jgi:hypothetical protein
MPQSDIVDFRCLFAYHRAMDQQRETGALLIAACIIRRDPASWRADQAVAEAHGHGGGVRGSGEDGTPGTAAGVRTL